MTSTPRRFVMLLLAAVPFVAVPVVSAYSVVPLGRIGAHWCRLLVARASIGGASDRAVIVGQGSPSPGAPSPEQSEPIPLGEDNALSPPKSREHGERPTIVGLGSTATRRAATARRARPNVFVGPDSIKRAIPMAGRPTSSWTNRTQEHPAGLLIQSPGALAGVIEPGDILVEAEGQALRSFEELIVTVKQAYERRVQRLSGRLFRRGDLVPVTVEPGW